MPRIESLTFREQQILEQIAEGKDNVNVAYALGITAATVSFTLTRIYRKLGVKNRTEAVISYCKFQRDEPGPVGTGYSIVPTHLLVSLADALQDKLDNRDMCLRLLDSVDHVINPDRKGPLNGQG